MSDADGELRFRPHSEGRRPLRDLYQGGPVQPPPNGYVNGFSTNGTNSVASTPHNASSISENRGFDGHDDSQSTTEFPRLSSMKGGTWPHSPSLHSEHAAAEPSEPVVSGPIPSYGLHEGDAGGPRSRAHANMQTYTDDQRIEHQYPRLSRPVELLRRSYDTVVIGSGYGGAVAASRLARAGESVCVLERGREKWPGEYPSGTRDAADELHWSGNLAPKGLGDGIAVDGGDPTGMYHLILGRGQHAVVGNGELLAPHIPTLHRQLTNAHPGLGGTSLINANVFLEANHDALRMKAWPEQIRNDPGCLDECKKHSSKHTREEG